MPSAVAFKNVHICKSRGINVLLSSRQSTMGPLTGLCTPPPKQTGTAKSRLLPGTTHVLGVYQLVGVCVVATSPRPVFGHFGTPEGVYPGLGVSPPLLFLGGFFITNFFGGEAPQRKGLSPVLDVAEMAGAMQAQSTPSSWCGPRTAGGSQPQFSLFLLLPACAVYFPAWHKR